VTLRHDLAALGERDFRLLFVGRTAASLGDFAGPVALTFAVLAIGGPADLGLVLGAIAAGMVVFLLPAGVLADRISRRLVLLLADLVRLVTQGIAAVLVLAGDARIWQLAVLSFAFGVGNAFFQPAATAIVPDVVSEARLVQANALLGISRAATMVAGPAIGGVLVATAGPGYGLALHAASFALSIAALLPMGVRPRPASPAAPFLAQLRGGFREVVSRPWLVATIAAFSGFSLVVLPIFFVLGPVVAERSLGGAGAWSVILTASAVGTLGGGVVALRWRPRRPLVTIWLLSLLDLPAMALLALAAPVPVIAAAAALSGASFGIFETFWQSLLQREIPDDALARVSSFDWFGSMLASPLGFALAGPLGVALGPAGALWLASETGVVVALAVLAVPSVRRLESAPRPQLPGRSAAG